MSEKIRIFNPIKNRFVNVNAFGLAAKKLYKIYIDDLSTPAENVLPPGLKYNAISGYFTRTKQHKEKVKEKVIYDNVKQLRFNPTFIDNQNVVSVVKQFMKQFAGKSVKVISFSNGNVKAEGVITIPTSFSSWWSKDAFFTSYIMIDSDYNIFSKDNNLSNPLADEGDADYGLYKTSKNQGALIVDVLQKVTGEKYKQSFLDGITHCLFTPIKEWAIEKQEESTTKTSIYRYKSINKKIDKYLIDYKEGVPEDDIQSIADNLQIGLSIDIPSPIKRKVNLLSVESQKKPLKVFKFINTRLDHIEINDLRALDNFEEIDKEELELKKKTMKENNEFYIYKSSKSGITQLNTLYKSYKVVDEFKELIQDFENDNNLSDFKINHTNNPVLSEFCKASVLTNNTIDFDELLQSQNPYDYNHIDMTKAYTKSTDCSYYEGILGKITDFRPTDKIMGLGLYQINNIKINNPVLESMKYIFNDNIYPSSELKFFKDNGVEFKIIRGCWGSKIDIDFGKGEEDNTDMFTKNNGVSAYCKWFGCLTICEEYTKWRFNTTNENYCKIMQYYQDDANVYYHSDDYNSYGAIEYKKRVVYHQSQIAAFITSYQRIAMMEQLLKFEDFSDVARVCVDGIYFMGDVELCKNFTYKSKKTFDNEAGKTYCNKISDGQTDLYWEDDQIQETEKLRMSKPRENNQYEYHKGPGGAGKTHANLIDTGLIDLLFVSNSWKLSRAKATEFNINSTCFYHLITADPDVWKPIYRNYSVILIDEVSMLSDHNKNIIINRFDKHKLIFAGDVNYQLDPVYSPYEYEKKLIGNFKPEYIIDDIVTPMITIEHNVMHRCKCEILKENLLMMRDLLEKNVDKISTQYLLKLLKNVMITDKDTIDYSAEDFIITNTHDKKDEYTNKFNHLDKFYIMNKSREYSKGQIVFTEPTEKGIKYERRHGFTIHSLQGETAQNKLFIDIRGIKSLKSLYTAISRAKYWSQINFIDNIHKIHKKHKKQINSDNDYFNYNYY